MAIATRRFLGPTTKAMESILRQLMFGKLHFAFPCDGDAFSRLRRWFAGITSTKKIANRTLNLCTWAGIMVALCTFTASCQAAATPYAVLKPAVAGGRLTPDIIDGIPFLKNPILTVEKVGGIARLQRLDIKARYLYVFGGVNSVDKPHFNWGGTDDFTNQFIGDRAGDLNIKYRSGITDTVPLIFGYTLWWRAGYNASPEPFKSDPGKRAILNRALCVANGIHDGSDPYFLRIVLRDQPVAEISIRDNSRHIGHPVIDGITFGHVTDGKTLDSRRFLCADGGPMPDPLRSWLADHSVASLDPMPRSRQAAIRDLQRAIYTFPSDINFQTIRKTPVHLKRPFPGPQVTFTGPPTAAIMTNVFLENADGLLGRVSNRTGTVHESAFKAPNYEGWVGYAPDLGAYYNDSYTRTNIISLLSNMGFLSKARKAVDYYDHWMMFFPRSYPRLQMGGKPVPAHATVIANKPLFYFNTLRKAGWPTKFKTPDYGNPETDGQGLLMIGTWRYWEKAGRPKQWVDRHWKTIHAVGNWIPWCLDHPKLSFSKHGLLYSESEGGMEMESLYCNVPCYYGLLAYAQMAEAAGKPGAARYWRTYAERLLGAMDAYFPAHISPWGDVWNPKRLGGWGPPTAMAPIIDAAVLYGYNAVTHLPTGWAARTRHAYAMMLSSNHPRFCDPSAMGYGQGFMTESALLLDQMHDATEMVDSMANLCFAPRQGHPYRVPESAVVKSNGSMWARGGDLGNLFQMGEVINTCDILLGIDDWHLRALKLMPRLPIGWTGMSVHNWPVRVLSSGQSQMAKLSMDLARDKNCVNFNLKISVNKPVDNVAIRLGPFPPGAKKLIVMGNHGKIIATPFDSGDSQWAWVRIGAILKSCRIRAHVQH